MSKMINTSNTKVPKMEKKTKEPMKTKTLNKNGVIVEEEEEYMGGTITQPFSPSDITLTNPPMNLGDLIEMIQAGWINFGTDYQRSENLWSERQQSRFIESVLLGLRLPAFYFEEVVPKRRWNIIDGLQRCCSIRNFCVDGTLSLSCLEFLAEEFDGKKYEDFDFATKRDVRMLPITVNVLGKGVPDMVKYVLFKRLNTGGISLYPQEIRNAVYSGPAIDVIKVMAKSKEFCSVTLNTIETKRRTDMDFASRFAAFYVLGWENYEPDLERFINTAMEFLNAKSTQDERDKLLLDFRKAMSMSKTLFGKRAFRKMTSLKEKRRPINKAYFEAISVTLAKLDEKDRQTVLENNVLLEQNMMTAMRDSKTYWNSFSGGTGDPISVRLRFSWMEKIIKCTIENKKIKIYDNKIVPEEL